MKHSHRMILAFVAMTCALLCALRNPTVMAQQQPTQGQASLVLRGRQVFMRMCEHCHDGLPSYMPQGPTLSEMRLTPRQVEAKVREGTPSSPQARGNRFQMPVFTQRRLSDPMLRAVIAYMQSEGSVRSQQ